MTFWINGILTLIFTVSSANVIPESYGQNRRTKEWNNFLLRFGKGFRSCVYTVLIDRVERSFPCSSRLSRQDVEREKLNIKPEVRSAETEPWLGALLATCRIQPSLSCRNLVKINLWRYFSLFSCTVTAPCWTFQSLCGKTSKWMYCKVRLAWNIAEQLLFWWAVNIFFFFF